MTPQLQDIPAEAPFVLLAYVMFILWMLARFVAARIPKQKQGVRHVHCAENCLVYDPNTEHCLLRGTPVDVTDGCWLGGDE